MQNSVLRASCFAGLLAVIASAAHGAPITVPTDLNFGDQYRLAFVTSTTRDATSSDIADYNAFVTAAANAVPELLALGATWTAIGSTDYVAARDNTDTNPHVRVGVPIYLLNDMKLADDNSDLWDGGIDYPFRITETGAQSHFSTVWTGTSSDGVRSPGNYLGNGGGIVMFGVYNSTESDWVQYDFDSYYYPRQLYAISSKLTVIPEPGTAALLALGLVGLAAVRRKA